MSIWVTYNNKSREMMLRWVTYHKHKKINKSKTRSNIILQINTPSAVLCTALAVTVSDTELEVVVELPQKY